MLDAKGYAALGHIYDAAINLGRWRRALDAVADSVEAKAIALLIRRPSPEARDLHMLNSTYLDFTRSPWGIYYGLRLARLQDPDWDYLSRQPAHKLTMDTETGSTAAELDARADYKLLRKRLSVGRRMGVRLNDDQVWFDAVSIAFESRKADVPRAVQRRTQLLLPHLTKAAEIGRTFLQLKSKFSAVLTSLDRVDVGLAVALPSGEIIVQNAEAKRITETQNGLRLAPDNHLRAQLEDKNSELETAIQKAADTARGEDSLPSHVMTLERSSGGQPLLLDIAPLKDSKAQLEDPLEGALITIIDPDRAPYLKIERFAALYGLTPAETEVCRFIIEGKSLDTIAEARNTSPVTAKNQVAAILDKTGTSRRAELIRLVVRVLPPVS
ncbi:MAG: helix-turn-helix transcriptional regulator [Pseudomonadota bacterium]